MSTHIFGHKGISAVISHAADFSSYILGTLAIKYSDAHQQAAIELRLAVDLHGFVGEQHINLVYHVDNLEPVVPALRDVDKHSLAAHIAQVVRPKSQMKILTLHLKTPCVVRCPLSSGSLTPNSPLDFHFRQVVEIAKASRIYILFDSEWLHPDRAGTFFAII